MSAATSSNGVIAISYSSTNGRQPSYIGVSVVTPTSETLAKIADQVVWKPTATAAQIRFRLLDTGAWLTGNPIKFPVGGRVAVRPQ